MKEKEYFYVVPNGTGLVEEENYYAISIDEINSLATFILTLVPSPAITLSFGYEESAFKYFSKNEHHLSECYKRMTSSFEGRRMLCTVIGLLLCERKFRNFGLSEKDLKGYSELIKMYQHDLNNSKILIEGKTQLK